MMILLKFILHSLFWPACVAAYKVTSRFGHSAVLVNHSLYFYGGDTALGAPANGPNVLSDLAVLPLDMPFALTRIPWKSTSGVQNTLGGPADYSHVAFVRDYHDMIIVGGMIPGNNLTDDVALAYSYDCIVDRWSSFGLPPHNYLNRQGASGTPLGNGSVLIWGGKRTRYQKFNESVAPLPSTMYHLDSINPSKSVMMPSSPPGPPLRYSHTQTLVKGRYIVILGGFDSLTGNAVAMNDIWILDTLSLHWKQEGASLDKDNKPANRSSHSQALMSDDTSILIYGGYDGYHVFNDVAVLDTRTWTWTVKNTNAAVQGRADHTATLIGNSMIVAFGFTGVSTSLTVMSDVEVLDITTWSWTSFYMPSSGFAGGGGGDSDGINGGENPGNTSGTPSMAIVAGAVTGGVIVLILVMMTLYIFNFQQKQQERALPPLPPDGLQHDDEDDDSTITPRIDQHHKLSDPFIRAIFSATPSSSTTATSPTLVDPSFYPSPSTSSSIATSPLTTTTTTTTATTTTTNGRTFSQRRKRQPSYLLPSPWREYRPTSGSTTTNNDVTATTTTTAITTTSSSLISKPDEPCHMDDKLTAAIHHATLIPGSHTDCGMFPDDKGAGDGNSNDEGDDGRFDRQEFILHTGEVSSSLIE